MARLFDGVDDIVSVADVAALRPGTGSFTMAAWVYPTALGGGTYHYIMSKLSGTNEADLLINPSDPSFRFTVLSAAGTGMDIYGHSFATLNTWQHVCGVRSAGSYGRIFLNGTLETETVGGTAANINNTGNLVIGATSTPTLFFTGRLAECAYWNVALSDDEVAALGRGAIPLTIRHDALVGYWLPYWDVASTIDWTKNGYNGTLTGTTVSDGPPVNRLPPQHYSFPTQGTVGTITSPDVCQASTPFNSFMSLPRSGDESDFAKLWDQTMQRIEDIINNRLLSDEACKACPDANGTVVLDLARCSNWEVDTDTPITRIDMPNSRPGQEVNVGICNRGSSPVTVGGWPSSVASGSIAGSLDPGECLSPTFQVGNDGSGSNRGGGFKLKGKPEPTKAPYGGALMIVCERGTCTVECSDGSASTLEMQAIGGVPPYEWETTVGTIATSGTGGADATLTPPANPGSAVAGTAYARVVQHRNTSGAGNACINDSGGNYSKQFYGCDDVLDTDWTQALTTGCNEEPSSIPDARHDWIDTSAECASGHAAQDGKGTMCDTRTQEMKDAGCVPCAVLSGATVTVTDGFGASVSKIIEVCNGCFH